MQLGSLVLKKVDFLVLPGTIGAEARGLLGQNILRVVDFELDLGHGIIRLFLPTDCKDVPLAYWAQGSGASSLKISDATALQPQIRFPARLQGHEIFVLLDTGAGYSLLARDAATSVGVYPNSPGVVTGGAIGGIGPNSEPSWIGPFKDFKLGDEEIRNTHLRFGGPSLLHADMLLGTDFLLSHRVYVANSQHRIYFTYENGPVFNVSIIKPPDASQSPSPEGAPGSVQETLADADAYERRASLHLARREWAAGAADLGAAIRLKPDDLNLRLKRGELLLSEHAYDQSRADADRAVAIDPDSLRARFLRIHVLVNSGQFAEAHSDAEAAERIAGNKQADLDGVASAYTDIGESASALRILDARLATKQDKEQRVESLNSRCWTRALAGTGLDLALADCDAALALNSKSAATLDSRGLVHLRRGEDRLALKDYERALSLSPQLNWSQLGHGLVLIRQGRVSEGRKEVADVLARSPEVGSMARRRGIELPEGL
jgi:tetratricopeptide (TPR) repeat protein